MNKFLKAFVALSIVILIVFTGIFTIKFIAFKDDFPKKIEINKINSVYSSKEEIVLTGKANSESEIFLSLNDKIGLIESDKNGNWIVNLGVLPEGKYNFQVISNGPQNSQSISATQIIVKDSVDIQIKETLTRKILKSILANVSFIYKNIPNTNNLITVSQFAPPVLNGEWELLN